MNAEEEEEEEEDAEEEEDFNKRLFLLVRGKERRYRETGGTV